jgi:hypothetical protein
VQAMRGGSHDSGSTPDASKGPEVFAGLDLSALQMDRETARWPGVMGKHSGPRRRFLLRRAGRNSGFFMGPPAWKALES